MKLDDRDEALGAALDRSFDGEGRPTPPEPTSVMRRGARRRASVIVASFATVAVFVGAIAFAAVQFGQDAPKAPANPAGPTLLVAPDIPWTVPIPPSWTGGGYRFAGSQRSILKDVRASFVSNDYVTFNGWPRLGPLPAGAAGDTVIVLTDQFVGLGDPTPSGSVSFNAEHEDRENPGWTIKDAKVCQLDDCVRVYVWHGPDVSMGDLHLATDVAEGVHPGSSHPSPGSLSPQVLLEDLAYRFTMSYPAGWTVAGSSLTPGLVDPVEIVSVSTFETQPGGRVVADMYLPGNALEHLGPDDVFISVQEFHETHWANPRPRPASFEPEVWCRDAECIDGSSQGLDPLRSWWIPFQDAGRGFVAFVAMGDEAFADREIPAAAWAVLDSLSFQGDGSLRGGITDPGWTSTSMGSSGDLQVTYPSGWRLSDRLHPVDGANAQPFLRLRTWGASIAPVCGEWGSLPKLVVLIGLQPLPPSQAVISVSEYVEGRRGPYRIEPRFIPRPSTTRWNDATIETQVCSGTEAETATFAFVDGGRRWIIDVAMGTDVRNRPRGDQVLEIVDRLGFPSR